MTERSLSEEFLLAFNHLKQITNDNPSTFVNFFNHKPEYADIMVAIKVHFDLVDRFINPKKKVIGPVSLAYIEARSDYKKRWAVALAYIEYKNSFQMFKELHTEEEPLSFLEFKANRYRELKIGLDTPSPGMDTEFDPRQHNGWEAIKLLIDVGREKCAESYTFFDQGGIICDEGDIFLHNIEKIADGALKFLIEDIGIDLEEVFYRYHDVPNFLIPKHVSDKHGLTARDGLYGLLNDAIKAFVAGAPAASIAMCRAVLEIILKQHYVTDHTYKTRDGKERDLGLKDLIIYASERFDFIQRKRTDRLRVAGDAILHNLSTGRKITNEEEETILDFFKTIAFLIERAPVNSVR